MIAVAYLVVLAAFGFGAMWCEHHHNSDLADWLGIVCLALLVLALLIL